MHQQHQATKQTQLVRRGGIVLGRGRESDTLSPPAVSLDFAWSFFCVVKFVRGQVEEVETRRRGVGLRSGTGMWL